ncbi:MAG: hypothetical protein JJ916_12170 [Phycisphaerales bacterium]|nr:hypothetical protein [Phycisphaerales bacterium]
MPGSQVQKLKRFRFLSTDKITGRMFKLCAEGESEDLAAERVWNLGFLISSSEPCPWVHDPTLKPKMKLIGEELTEDSNHLEGKVRSVLRTDFKSMAQEINTECDWEDRHWLLNELVAATERKDDPADRMFCELFCWQWFVESEEIVRTMVSRRPENQRMMYEVNAVDRLRIMHDGERKAQVCDYATSLPFPLPNHQWLIKKSQDYRDGHL